MAKKTKQKKRAGPARRAPSPARPTSTVAPLSDALPEAEATTTAAPASAIPVRRGVQRVDPAAQRRTPPARGRGADAGFAPLDPDDAAIPFDRVPYVPADLRRVALMAGIMVVLIIVANLVISHLVG